METSVKHRIAGLNGNGLGLRTAETREVDGLLQFYRISRELKGVIRYKNMKFWKDYPKPERYESTPDHTWMMGLMLMKFKDRLSQPLDMEKAFKMIILHDLAEMISGDPSPLGTDGTGRDSHAYNPELKKEKHEREKAAMVLILAPLPEKERKELFELWLEYERQECFEARVVNAIDKVEAFHHVLLERDGHMFKAHLEFSIGYALRVSNVDPVIDEYAHMIADEMRMRYREFVPGPDKIKRKPVRSELRRADSASV